MERQEQRDCPQCGANLYHNKGISQKNNRPYENWKCSKCGFLDWVSSNNTGNPKTKYNFVNEKTLVIDEVVAARKEINERLDNLAAYLVKKLGPVDQK